MVAFNVTYKVDIDETILGALVDKIIKNADDLEIGFIHYMEEDGVVRFVDEKILKQCLLWTLGVNSEEDDG